MTIFLAQKYLVGEELQNIKKKMNVSDNGHIQHADTHTQFQSKQKKKKDMMCFQFLVSTLDFSIRPVK